MKKLFFIIAAIVVTNSLNAQYNANHTAYQNHEVSTCHSQHPVYPNNPHYGHHNQPHAHFCNVSHGYHHPSHNPYGGYYNVLSNYDVDNIIHAINNEAFSSDKMNIARQALYGKNIKAKQVAEIGRLFDFESDRLKFSKIAYANTIDKHNYYKVNSIFHFSSSKTELSRFIYQ